jgi:hypothetical protein
MAKNIRNLQGNNVQDPATLHNLEYNDAAGSKKVSEVGRHLLPIPFISGGAVAYTTDATTARALPNAGLCLAVYNNAGAVGAITLGEDAASVATALAPGVADATGHVGIPCAPNAWTYIACSNQNWIKSSAATLLVFIIDDNTSVKQEARK